MNITAVAFTDRGLNLSKELQRKSDGKITSFFSDNDNLSAWIEKNFFLQDALILITNTETAIKLVSPYLFINKNTPSIIVLDELGKFVIPIVSGTNSFANELASAIASFIDSVPVITSSTEIANVFSVDTWAKSIGLRIANPENIKYISSKLISGETVHFDSVFPITGEHPKGIMPSEPSDISDFSITYLSSVPEKTLHLVPPVLTLGICCSSDSPVEEIENAYTQFLNECGCHPLSVYDTCTVSHSNSPNGLIEFCKKNELGLRFFSSDDLSKTFIQSEAIGDNLDDKACEQCAILGSGGTLFVRSMKFGEITLALAIKEPDIT